MEAHLPFEILGFDSDNGSEFLNQHLIRYFQERPKKVGFTRSRTYKKNDNAHVEQKNWTHVRQLFGYDRFGDEEILPLMNEIYSDVWEPLNNFFKPCMKLLKKERHGSKIKKYYLVVPEEFEGVIRLLNVKFMELFGRNIVRDVETFEYVPHATTVVPANELFITFGRKMNPAFGKNQLLIPLPKNANYATMMAVGYYVVGKIQKAHPAWFKKNIVNYMKMASKEFGKEMKVIVE